jgi:hypothetical protein
MKTAARIELPPLPDVVDEVTLPHTVGTSTASLGGWRDLAGQVAALLSDDHRGELAACSKKSRTVWLDLDDRGDKPHVLLPAWQFHSASGDGTTPAEALPIKRCLAHAVSTWTVPVLVDDMGSVRFALRVK